MHYAVPRILQRFDMLEMLCTDACAARGWPRAFTWLPRALRFPALDRFLGRTAEGITLSRITAFNLFGLRYFGRQHRAKTPADSLRTYLRAGREFGELILRRGFADANAVYCFTSAGLEIMQAARRRGLTTVLEQSSSPKTIELEILIPEFAHHPEWRQQPEDVGVIRAFAERERAEWAAADRIICPSDFVKEGIAKCGGPVERCRVVPYGVEPPARPPSNHNQTASDRAGAPLHVLVAGKVCLQKGSHYVLETARLTKGTARFRMVGSITGVPAPVLAQLREHLEVLGPVPRTAMPTHYAWANLLLLPSLCEGSATVTYEALSHGVPVVCTPNTGSVIRHGVEGFIIPPRNARAIAACIQRLRTDSGFTQTLSGNARARSAEFTLDRYGERLVAALAEPV